MNGAVKGDNVAGHRKEKEKIYIDVSYIDNVSFSPLKMSIIHLKGLKIASDFSPSLIL